MEDLLFANKHAACLGGPFSLKIASSFGLCETRSSQPGEVQGGYPNGGDYTQILIVTIKRWSVKSVGLSNSERSNQKHHAHHLHDRHHGQH